MAEVWNTFIQVNIYGRTLKDLQNDGIYLKSVLSDIGCSKTWIVEGSMYDGESSDQDETINQFGPVLSTTMATTRAPYFSTPAVSRVDPLSKLNTCFFGDLSAIASRTSSEFNDSSDGDNDSQTEEKRLNGIVSSLNALAEEREEETQELKELKPTSTMRSLSIPPPRLPLHQCTRSCSAPQYNLPLSQETKLGPVLSTTVATTRAPYFSTPMVSQADFLSNARMAFSEDLSTIGSSTGSEFNDPSDDENDPELREPDFNDITSSVNALVADLVDQVARKFEEFKPKTIVRSMSAAPPRMPLRRSITRRRSAPQYKLSLSRRQETKASLGDLAHPSCCSSRVSVKKSTVLDNAPMASGPILLENKSTERLSTNLTPIIFDDDSEPDYGPDYEVPADSPRGFDEQDRSCAQYDIDSDMNKFETINESGVILSTTMATTRAPNFSTPMISQVDRLSKSRMGFSQDLSTIASNSVSEFNDFSDNDNNPKPGVTDRNDITSAVNRSCGSSRVSEKTSTVRENTPKSGPILLETESSERIFTNLAPINYDDDPEPDYGPDYDVPEDCPRDFDEQDRSYAQYDIDDEMDEFHSMDEDDDTVPLYSEPTIELHTPPSSKLQARNSILRKKTTTVAARDSKVVSFKVPSNRASRASHAQLNKIHKIKCEFTGCKSSQNWKPRFGKRRLLDHALTHYPEAQFQCHLCRTKKFEAKTNRVIRYHYQKKHPSFKFNKFEIRRIEKSPQKVSEIWEKCYSSQLHLVGKLMAQRDVMECSSLIRGRGKTCNCRCHSCSDDSVDC